MSWWDTSNLTSFATNVVKSAQKKIDKVLDIDGGVQSSQVPGVSSKPSKSKEEGVENQGEFWNAWLGSSEERSTKKQSGNESSNSEESGDKKKTARSWKSWGFEDSDSSHQSDVLEKSPTPASPDSTKLKLKSSLASKRNQRAAREKNRRKRSEKETQDLPLKDDSAINDILQSEFTAKDDTAPISATKDDTAPISATKDDTAPISATKDDTAPISATKDDSAPISATKDDTAPISSPQVLENLSSQEPVPNLNYQTTSNPEILTISATELEKTITEHSIEENKKIESDSLIEFYSPGVLEQNPFPTDSKNADSILTPTDPELSLDDTNNPQVDAGIELQISPSETFGLSEPGSLEMHSATEETESLVDSERQLEIKDSVESDVVKVYVDTDVSSMPLVDVTLSKVDLVDTELVDIEESDTDAPLINTSDTATLAEGADDVESVPTIGTYSPGDMLPPCSDSTGSEVNLEGSESDKLVQSNLSVTEQNFDNSPSTYSSMEIVSESEIDKICDAKESISREVIPRETTQDSVTEELSCIVEDYVGSITGSVESRMDSSSCVNVMAVVQEEDTDDMLSDKDNLLATSKGFSQSDESRMTESSSSSVVKTMLEEAMEDNIKQEECDSHSHSSSDKSDFVKSEFSDKGHESGDEIDTTTSSDIEIISTPTPNGDRDRPFDLSPLKIALSRANRHGGSAHRRTDSQSSSSTNSKLEQMSPGRDLEFSDDAQEHTLLDLSSHFHQGRDDTHRQRQEVLPEYKHSNPYESEKLLKMHVCDTAVSVESVHDLILPTIAESCTSEPTEKMAEMAEVINVRENKLVQLSKENNDLLEANSILRNQLQQSEDSRESEMADLNILTEEFTQRLGESERKLQAILREKDGLKKQLEITQSEVIKKGDTSKFQKLIAEKDEQLQELLKEGEKLSKQQLQGNTIIKKLRSKEKETEQLSQSQKKTLETQTTELEHLKKVLDSKEEMEKKQSDAISQLNNAVQRQEKEIARLKSELDEHHEKLRGTQAALDTSYKEIAELHRDNATKDSKAQEVALSADMQAREELRFTMEREQQRYRQEKEALIMQIEDLRISLSRMEKEYGRKEDMLRQEISDLQQRSQEDEARNQELTHSVTSATRPLLRQIENLQSTYNAQSNSFETVEKNITERLSEVQTQLLLTVEKERMSSEKVIELQAQVIALEAQNIRYRQEKSQLNAQHEIHKTKIEMLEDSRNSDIARVEAVRQSCSQEIGELKRQKLLLENQLEMEKTKVETEKKKMVLLQDELKERQERERPLSRNTPSPAQFSLQESTASIQDPLPLLPAFTQEELLERSLMIAPHSPNGNKMSLYESLRQTGAANLLDNLISQLKQREGEITQLQSEITDLERTRESMARELVNLSTDNVDLKDQIEELPELKEKHKDLEQRYNAILQMYGEKVEETEELKLDLQDVKELYKSQIDHLMKGH